MKRQTLVLRPDQTRVLMRPFQPGDSERVKGIVQRILALPEDQVPALLDEMLASFSPRHQNLRGTCLKRFTQVSQSMPEPDSISEERRTLIGSYFLAEYSLESAALFNPSIVPHPDQSRVPVGALRFILSLRATGEGHISSITFRSGIIHPDNRIELIPPTGFLTEPSHVSNPLYEKDLFARKLGELGLNGHLSRAVMDKLGCVFGLDDLLASLQSEQVQIRNQMVTEEQTEAHGIWMLAKSNFDVEFEEAQPLSERVLFPATPSQRNGIEDARFVRFEDDDGTSRYFATFTAYDGVVVMPQLVETADFLRFRFITLNGPAAKNKGMALFPRRINGQYAMLSRQDNENIYLMYSDNVHFWNEYQLLLKPAFPWELVQIGNCGSPIETDAGWLVLSHGVGAMREYSISAFLLDRDDPSKLIGRLRKPLLTPNQEEREGYVPNVVYTCGAIVHGDTLVIPYGLADHATGFATVPLDDVLAQMRSTQ